MRILNISLVAGVVLLICGCSPSFVSTDSAVYSVGKLHAVSSADMTQVYQASLATMDQLELKVTEHAKDAFAAKVVAKAVDGKTIKVSIRPGELEGSTRFTIRAGDRDRAQRIYKMIQENLGMGK